MNGEEKDTVTVIYCGNEMKLFNKKKFPIREAAKKFIQDFAFAQKRRAVVNRSLNGGSSFTLYATTT